MVAMLPQVVPELLAERQNSGKKVMQVWDQGQTQTLIRFAGRARPSGTNSNMWQRAHKKARSRRNRE